MQVIVLIVAGLCFAEAFFSLTLLIDEDDPVEGRIKAARDLGQKWIRMDRLLTAVLNVAIIYLLIKLS